MALLAAYSFDEASGNVLDVTGQGHDFALAGSTVRTTSGSGHTDKGLTQTSTTDDTGPSLFGQTALRTLMMWVKTTADFTGWIFEFHDNTNDTGRWGLLCLGATMGYRGTGSGGAVHASRARPTDNLWHHWAGTYDGTTLRTYFDGALVGSGSALAGGILTDADLIRIFTSASSSTTIDDLRVYDEALDLATITALMNTPVGTPVLGYRSTSWHPGRGPSRAARFYQTPRAITSAVAAVAEQGVSGLGVTGTGTAVKVANVSGVCSMGMAAAGVAAKRAPAAGPSTVGLAGSGTARKVAPAAGQASTGLAPAARAAAIHPQAGAAALGVVTRAAGGKRAPVVGAATVGVAATHSGLVVRAVSGICSVGLVGSSSPRKTAVTGAVTALGATTTGAGRKQAVETGACGLGVASRGVVLKRAVQSGAALLGVAPTGNAAKVTSARGIAMLAVASTALSIPPEPVVTPPERMFAVPAESRVFAVAAETRIFPVPAEQRVWEA